MRRTPGEVRLPQHAFTRNYYICVSCVESFKNPFHKGNEAPFYLYHVRCTINMTYCTRCRAFKKVHRIFTRRALVTRALKAEVTEEYACDARACGTMSIRFKIEWTFIYTKVSEKIPYRDFEKMTYVRLFLILSHCAPGPSLFNTFARRLMPYRA